MEAKEGQCQEMVQRRVSRGIIGKGTESFTTQIGFCSRKALPGGDLCKIHQDRHEKMVEANKARRAR